MLAGVRSRYCLLSSLHTRPSTRTVRGAIGIAVTSTNTCLLFRTPANRHSSASPLKTPNDKMGETSPLNRLSPRSPAQSSRTTEAVDEELGEVVDTTQLSWKERAKSFASEYGRVGIATHIVLSTLSFTVIYIGVSSGIDVTSLLQSAGISTDSAGKEAAANSAGSFLIAYTLYKMLAPVRWPLTFAVTPVVMRALRRRGYMLPKTKSTAHRSPLPDAEEASARDQHHQSRK